MLDNKTTILQAANALAERSPQLALALRAIVRNGVEAVSIVGEAAR